MIRVLQLGTGKMSTFGGPADFGIQQMEGLALIQPEDLAVWPFSSLFYPKDSVGNVGLGRQLNPHAYYCAMRWDEVLKPFGIVYNDATKAMLKRAYVALTNPTTSHTVFARPVDYGPGDGRVIDGQHDPDTDRLVDMAPACAEDLGLDTDQLVRAELIWPEAQS